jgi:16S rRNA (uracil1498-N3)-methyltransferase
MRISRLFVDSALNTGQTLELDKEAAHYVRTVLRLKNQQNLIVFNGRGNEFKARLEQVSRKSVIVTVLSEQHRNVETSLTIKLGLGISRGERMDWAIQKAVELGVSQITPLLTERTVVKLTAEKQQQRLRHWQGIIQHATEQSGRTYLTELTGIETLPDWVNHQQASCFFLDPYAEKNLYQMPPPTASVTLLSGPEGGFSPQERDTAATAGFTPVKLGPRILRTETAVLAAVSAIQTLWGDFS